jgi:hypothetical protein
MPLEGEPSELLLGFCMSQKRVQFGVSLNLNKYGSKSEWLNLSEIWHRIANPVVI